MVDREQRWAVWGLASEFRSRQLSDSYISPLAMLPSMVERKIPIATLPKMTPGRAVLIGLMDRYLGGLLDPFVSLLEVHNLMYFAQEAGPGMPTAGTRRTSSCRWFPARSMTLSHY